MVSLRLSISQGTNQLRQTATSVALKSVLVHLSPERLSTSTLPFSGDKQTTTDCCQHRPKLSQFTCPLRCYRSRHCISVDKSIAIDCCQGRSNLSQLICPPRGCRPQRCLSMVKSVGTDYYQRSQIHPNLFVPREILQNRLTSATYF